MPLRVYNTLTRTKEEFRTVEPGKVGMYVCGPTVYKPSHIGHMVGPVIFDSVKRYLTYCGYAVTWVVNITDVDDKLIVRARELNTTVKDLAERMTADYVDSLRALNVTGIDDMPRATQHIPGMIEMIGVLIAKGFAYAAAGDVYFDIGHDGGLWQAVQPRPRTARGRLAGRGQRQEAQPRRLRPVEGGQGGGAAVGQPLGSGPTRLAHRMLGHERAAPRQDARHPRRRPRPPVPAPRERTGPVGVVQRRPVRALLDAQRPACRWAASKMAGSVGNVVNIVDLFEEVTTPRR